MAKDDPRSKPLPCAPAVFMKPGETFGLGDSERTLFDGIATEIGQIAGTQVDFWSQDLVNSSRDPLYDEPIERVFKGPFRLKGILTWPESTPGVRLEGLQTTFDGQLWMARAALEESGAPDPSEGDVIRIWNVPYYNRNWGTSGEEIPGSGYFFNLMNVNEDGHINDTATFVGFTSIIKRRTDMSPERRLLNK